MTDTVLRRKLEILVDAPLVRRITAAAEAAGVSGYTLLPAAGGMGRGGRWSDDQLTGAEAKLIFMTVTNVEKAAALIDALAPMLDSHGLLLMASDVEVVRGARF
jgi:PII-like signaling protein